MVSPVRTVSLLLLFSALTVVSLTACNTPQGNATEGKKWFAMHNCSACHGENANNGKAAAISAIEMSYGAFSRFLRNPDSPSMPRFPESKLPKEDAADIYAWLKSMPE